MVNGNIYDQAMGTKVIANDASNGCDSTVIVNLGFENQVINNLSQMLCLGDSIEVGGTFYNQDNPTGTETLEGMPANGCDISVTINLSFESQVINNLTLTLCIEESIQVGEETFFQDTATGSVIIVEGSVSGCDSLVNVALSFYPIAQSNFNPVLCDGESLTINGELYGQANSFRFEILSGLSVNSCHWSEYVLASFETKLPS